MDENESTQETVKPKERSINELIDLPYSEMTDEEIARVVDFKAAIKARDTEFKRRMEEMQNHLEEIKAVHMETARNADALLAELTAHAINDYKAASNGQA
jgi:hypothetical protein